MFFSRNKTRAFLGRMSWVFVGLSRVDTFASCQNSPCLCLRLGMSDDDDVDDDEGSQRTPQPTIEDLENDDGVVDELAAAATSPRPISKKVHTLL